MGFFLKAKPLENPLVSLKKKTHKITHGITRPHTQLCPRSYTIRIGIGQGQSPSPILNFRSPLRKAKGQGKQVSRQVGTQIMRHGKGDGSSHTNHVTFTSLLLFSARPTLHDSNKVLPSQGRHGTLRQPSVGFHIGKTKLKRIFFFQKNIFIIYYFLNYYYFHDLL